MSIRTTQTLLLAGVMALTSWQATSAQTPAAATASVQLPGSKTSLGDLSSFRGIAVDTQKIVGTGDFGAAKKRIKDLELSWDQAEPKLKPLSPEKWQTVDVAIDRALKEVRAWRTTPVASGDALQALIATIDTLK